MTHTPTLSAFLIDLGTAGVEVEPHPARPDLIRHRPATLPPDLAARLQPDKPALLALLAHGYHPTHPEAEYVFAERMGIADDLGMPAHAGAPAWLIAVGCALMARDSAAVVCSDQVRRTVLVQVV